MKIKHKTPNQVLKPRETCLSQYLFNYYGWCNELFLHWALAINAIIFSGNEFQRFWLNTIWFFDKMICICKWSYLFLSADFGKKFGREKCKNFFKWLFYPLLNPNNAHDLIICSSVIVLEWSIVKLWRYKKITGNRHCKTLNSYEVE